MTLKRIDIGARMTQVVVHENTAYFAGMVAEDASGSVKEQAQQILAKIEDYLHEAGSDKSRILFTQIWLADMADYAAFNEIWDGWIVPGSPPPRACVQSVLAHPDWRVELQVTAALQENTDA